MPIFKPIKPQKISEEVLSQLKKSILRGVFKAGDKLPSERQLTEQFHVSRGVVREAIKALEVTGFVNIRQGPTGGAFVNEVNFDRFNSGFLDLYLAYKLTMPELIQFRLFVEPEVTRLATLNLNDAYRRRLEEAINAEREVFESHDQRMKKLSEIHFVLAEMCGNQLLKAWSTPSSNSPTRSWPSPNLKIPTASTLSVPTILSLRRSCPATLKLPGRRC